MNFKKLRDESFANNFCKGIVVTSSKRGKTKELTDGNNNSFFGVKEAEPISIQFPQSTSINCVVLREYLLQGQSIAQCHVTFYDENNNALKTINATTIGNKRILTFPTVSAKRMEITVDKEDAPASLTEAEAYKIDDALIEQ